MLCLRLLFIGLAALFPLLAQDVGQGAPAGLEQQFVNAFYRNQFSSYVSLPAAGNVRKLGATGYVQEFNPVRSGSSAASKFALVKSNGTGAFDVYQMYPGVYAVYSTVGADSAGFPTMDPGTCSTDISGQASSVCSYQLFTGNYALFAYTSSLLTGDASASYTIKDPFYTRWNALGGVTAFGPPTTAEATITGKTGITATVQTYTYGAFYSITSGALTGKVFGVGGKIYALYNSSGLHLGSLGLPLSDELQMGSGRIRQNFEGGNIELAPGGEPEIRPAVGSVGLSIATGAVTRMNIGETLSIRAIILATIGGELTDRDVSWITSNGRAVSIQPSGRTALLRAVGGGTAQITAVSEGKSSSSLTIFVAAPCCQIGEGAPTLAIQQSFQDLVTRLRLNIALPAANPVRRAGLGYVQELHSADGSARYLLCRSDFSSGVFLVSGDVLKAYETEGGPAGRLAYPVADETATGRQMFEGGALAGRPVQVVTNPVLPRWQTSGYETGPVGAPSAAARSYLTFTGATGVGQLFAQGFLSVIQTGPLAATKAVLVRGRFLARYAELNGPDGSLGFAFTEEYNSTQGPLVQDFEGGQLRLPLDGSEVEVIERERTPEVSITPSKVTAGGRVRIIAGGFPQGAAIRVTFGGAAGLNPFEVQTQQGSYTWESPVPVNSRTGVVTVTASEAGSNRQATGSYTITSLTDANVVLSKLRGDTQTGLPGARLPNPLVVALKDDLGAPLVGIPVKFTASPGSRIQDGASAFTDERGEAQAYVRLLSSEGVALITAEASNKVVTFGVRAAAGSLLNYPKQLRAGSVFSSRESLLASASSAIRYHQARNELPSSLGLSDPTVLNGFLKDFCVLDTGGGRICDGFLSLDGSVEQIPNLWRLRDFVGNNLDVETSPAEDAAIVDLLAQGAPALISLAISDSAGLSGTHFVVAIGVASDGGIVIHDPDPLFGRQRLSDYTSGFSSGGNQWKAVPLHVVRLAPRSPSPTGFLVTAYRAAIIVESISGSCGRDLVWPLGDGRGGRPGGETHLYYCAGLDKEFVVGYTAPGAYTGAFTDLGSPGRRQEFSGTEGQTFSATHPNSQWQIGQVQLSLDASQVLNGATFTPELGPGSLAAIFGTGLGGGGSAPVVEIAGLPAKVQYSGEFRVNVEIPKETPAGEQTLAITSAYGTIQIPVMIQLAAPAIFSDEKTKRGLIINVAGGEPNTVANPAARGSVISIYATGLGAVRPQGNLTVTDLPVAVVLFGRETPASFAGPAEGLPGVYVVTVMIPSSIPPGLDVPVSLRQGGVDSNQVSVAIR